MREAPTAISFSAADDTTARATWRAAGWSMAVCNCVYGKVR